MTSGYCTVLDLASSLLTMFNTPWGKFRWLRLSFGLKKANDVFQERLDRVFRLLECIHRIADHILTHRETEIQHNGRLLTLLKTATQPWQNTVQVYRLQILWTQTDPRRPQTRSWESQGHSWHETTAVYAVSPEFQWYVKLFKKIQLSPNWALIALEKTAKMRYSLGLGVWTTEPLKRSRLYWLHSQPWHILIKTRIMSYRLMHQRLDSGQSYYRRADL